VAADAPAGPIKVTNYGKKAAVTFKHSIHKKGFECQSCHHNEGDGNYKCGSAKCHLAEYGKIPKLMDAAHKKTVGKCWACHFKASPSVKKPLKCKQCHVK
jgi:hypothetical protein